jgi:hypothetical protein
MGLTFLAPLFALGLAALAIPILVHLVHKERKDPIEFPSLMFLRRVPFQHSSRQRLRHLLLFALRALAFLMVIAAFARPLVDKRAVAASTSGGGREVVLLLDRSFSMGYADRWTRALEAARKVIASVGKDDRVSIIPFDLRSGVVNEPTNDQAILRAAVDSIRPSDAGTRYAPPLTLARRIVAASRLPRREVVVISDFQRSGWDVTDEAVLPAGVALTPVDVSAGEVRDRAVRGVDLRRDLSAAQERIAVTARVSNVGPAAKAVPVSLEINGRQVETRTADLPADAGASVSFDPVPIPDAPARAVVRIADTNLAGDDTYQFILQRAPTVEVLVIEPPQASAEHSLFLSRALEIGDQPRFEVTVRRADRLAPNDLTARPLVIVNGAAFPDGGLGRRIVDGVKRGGGLIVSWGERNVSARLSAPGRELIGIEPGAPIDRTSERGGVLGYADRSHPALAVFSAARSGDLSAARFLRYRSLDAATGVLLRFDDGAPALVERSGSGGRVLLWTSSLDGVWNDFPRQPVFLPFVHQLARYASGHRERRTSYAVGEAVDLSSRSAAPPATDSATARPAVAAEEAFVSVAPSGQRTRVGGAGNARALEVLEKGFHEVRRAGAPGERPQVLAVNVAPTETDLAAFDPTRLTQAVVPLTPSGGAAADSVTRTASEREREQALWRYLLFAGALALLAEALLAERLSRGRVVTT